MSSPTVHYWRSLYYQGAIAVVTPFKTIAIAQNLIATDSCTDAIYRVCTPNSALSTQHSALSTSLYYD
ncbi:hypothetical protein I8752_05165 [Nostocaceae cyanobacterium CENA369]|uniref:Uncharacterized protein n=1 Tax=Dendronalium phyllosphericum CENA369 TaxID=1725256 RepID=A0A8J7I1T7_9NOST|nr:hypothetical protein [Dendronalium phyllosphericum]MBH8572433.1 hypothetical protein [Dendronalium phyllosphericum CENA369]